MNTEKGTIYLIQPAELVGTNRYKIGCSSKNDLERCKKGYKKGTRFMDIRECDDPFAVEREVKTRFNTKFNLVAGKEYFEGNETDIKKEFNDVVSNFTSLKCGKNGHFVNECPINNHPENTIIHHLRSKVILGQTSNDIRTNIIIGETSNGGNISHKKYNDFSVKCKGDCEICWNTRICYQYRDSDNEYIYTSCMFCYNGDDLRNDMFVVITNLTTDLNIKLSEVNPIYDYSGGFKILLKLEKDDPDEYARLEVHKTLIEIAISKFTSHFNDVEKLKKSLKIFIECLILERDAPNKESKIEVHKNIISIMGLDDNEEENRNIIIQRFYNNISIIETLYSYIRMVKKLKVADIQMLNKARVLEEVVSKSLKCDDVVYKFTERQMLNKARVLDALVSKVKSLKYVDVYFKFKSPGISVHLFLPKSKALFNPPYTDNHLNGYRSAEYEIDCRYNFNKEEKTLIKQYNIQSLDDLLRCKKISYLDKSRALKCYKYVCDRTELMGIEPYDGNTSIQLGKYHFNLKIFVDKTVKFIQSGGISTPDDITISMWD